MRNKFKNIMMATLLILLVGCSVVLVTRSNGTTINQTLDEELDADLKVSNIKKDTIK